MSAWRHALALATALLAAAPVLAQPKKLSLGVYLPISIDGRDKQFEFVQALAGELGSALGATVSPKPFARFEDFARASSDGVLDLGVADAVVLAQARADYPAFATAQLEADPAGRWSIVAEQQTTVGRLKGKRLALVKGPGSDADFVTNMIFAGDLPTGHFQLVYVPALESLLKALEAGKADVALLPSAHAPSALKVLYRSTKIPAAVLLNFKADAAALKAALEALNGVAPFGRFQVGTGDEVGQLKRRISRPPPARAPLISESPLYRPGPELLSPYKSAGLSFPTFLEFLEASKDHPDD